MHPLAAAVPVPREAHPLSRKSLHREHRGRLLHGVTLSFSPGVRVEALKLSVMGPTSMQNERNKQQHAARGATTPSTYYCRYGQTLASLAIFPSLYSTDMAFKVQMQMSSQYLPPVRAWT